MTSCLHLRHYQLGTDLVCYDCGEPLGCIVKPHKETPRMTALEIILLVLLVLFLAGGVAASNIFWIAVVIVVVLLVFGRTGGRGRV